MARATTYFWVELYKFLKSSCEYDIGPADTKMALTASGREPHTTDAASSGAERDCEGVARDVHGGGRARVEYSGRVPCVPLITADGSRCLNA